MNESTLTQTDERFNQTLEDYSLKIDRQRFWAYIQDACTETTLRVFRPWELDVMTADCFEASIETAIDEYEYRPIDLSHRGIPRNPATGMFVRYGG